MHSKRLGELLVEDKILSDEQLYEALNLQSKTGEKLGQTLIRYNFLTLSTLIEYLGRQKDSKVINPYEIIIDKAAVSTVSERTAWKYEVAPIGFTTERIDKKLILAMTCPSDVDTIRQIEFESGYSVQPVYIIEEYLNWLIRQCYNMNKVINV